MGLLAHADHLVAHLETVSGLDGVIVPHVDRKFDMREEALKVLSKRTSGAYLGINLAGWTRHNPESEDFSSDLRFECSFVTVPTILEHLELPDWDVLLLRVVNGIEGYAPPGISAYDTEYHWRVQSGGFIPDDDFLVYQFPAFITEDFHDPIAPPEE